ncbi:hypothetical protein [Gilvimarinus sp. DA14]|uniref:hypothetical protein n=1 Tax=Gilvimarinus sp. DA14 TaxID=2956798 RepID=UPI0020B701C1|nr:hypothetical protein [Gilvimarinus sp. DA14]UTF59522.1 hypothetical protein NHM04_13725 [Gilvimarinus sp. DA14]
MRALVLAAASLLAACQYLTETSAPALLVAPSDATRAELTSTVSRALGTKVVLSAQALTHSPRLIIDAPTPSSLQNQGGAGLTMDRPDHFTLWLENGQCILKHEESDKQWVLQSAHCAAM